ncbi:uncharacterized protein LOC132901859 [Amyelois transitella]|uniref:uncharacterized protein LOC132901859 n=1 Tax=Amyelois transitella TaxID=680683 RepID=UPI00298F8E7D|nr:uncharacterized protein LOC132901859 [Amyelois transitella]
MATQRSPPPINRVQSNEPRNLALPQIGDSLSRAHSDPSLNVTQRGNNKRVRRDSNDKPIESTEDSTSLKALIAAQNTKLETIINSIKDLQGQMGVVQNSVEFMSSKYDELLGRCDVLEEERRADKAYIKQLEGRIENLDRTGKMTCIEIKYIPARNRETRSDLCDLVQSICNAICVPLNKEDIKNIYRQGTNKQIVAEFITVTKRQDILAAVKKFNRTDTDKKLNTSHISMEGPPQPIYIAELLTFKNKKLYAMARDSARMHKYKFCWIAQGSVFMRKMEGSPAIRINEESDFGLIQK